RKYNEGKKNYIRCAFERLKDKEAFEEVLKELNVRKTKIHEGDINPVDIFLSRLNIDTSGWIEACCCEVEGDKSIISTCKREYTTTYDLVRRCLEDEMQAQVLRPIIMCMDIECYSSNPNAMPDSFLKSDVIFMISVVSQ